MIRSLNQPAFPPTDSGDHGKVRRWHVLVLALMALAFAAGVLSGFITGYKVAQHYDAAYYANRYAMTLNEPHPPASAPQVTLQTEPPPAQPQAGVTWMPGVLDQGAVGQCQCEGFAIQYEHLIEKRTGKRLRFSCRWWYAVVTKGHYDEGSTEQQYIELLWNEGGILHRQYDYAGLPTNDQLQYAESQAFAPLAAAHRYKLGAEQFSVGMSAGYGGVNACENEIVRNRTCNLGLPVFTGQPACNGLFDVNADGGAVDSPATKSCTIAGYHALTLRAYNRNLCLALNGGTQTCGFFEAQNSWGVHYGVNCTTWQPDETNGGCLLISFRLMAEHGFSVQSLRLERNTLPQATEPPPPFRQGGPGADVPLPAPPAPPGAPRIGTGTAFTYHVWAKDVPNLDLAPIINRVAAEHHISAVGMLAVLEAECGLYTHSYTCDRLGGGLDYSFGVCQLTVSTISMYGVGNGQWDGYYGPNATLVRTTENNAARCIGYAGRLLGDYSSYERQNCPGAADFPNLYVAWNAGPGQPCWFLLQPNGQAGSNFYGNFLSWYRTAYTYAVFGHDPYTRPKPRRFNLKGWCSYAVAHRKACPNPRQHGKLIWAAAIYEAHPQLGGKKGGDHYYGGRHGYDLYHYAHGVAFAWPSYHRYKVR